MNKADAFVQIVSRIQPWCARCVSAVVLLCAVGAVELVHAEGAVAFTNPLGNITLYDFLIKVLQSVIYILFPIIILMIVYTGFLFVVAQGNEQKLTEARRALVWTLIGGAVVLGSVAISLAIKATVNGIVNG